MISPADLLSDNDWNELQGYLQSKTTHKMTRTMEGITLEITVESVDSPAWRVSRLIGIKATYGDWMARQWFESVAAARKELGTWSLKGVRMSKDRIERKKVEQELIRKTQQEEDHQLAKWIGAILLAAFLSFAVVFILLEC